LANGIASVVVDNKSTFLFGVVVVAADVGVNDDDRVEEEGPAAFNPIIDNCENPQTRGDDNNNVGMTTIDIANNFIIILFIVMIEENKIVVRKTSSE
jgi:hypothetical protein